MGDFRLAVIISGRGTTMLSVAEAIERGELDAQIRLVVSNRPDAPGNDLARAHGLPVLVVDRRDGRPRAERHREILAALQHEGVDLVVCAGFDEVLIPEVTDAYPGRIINTHPSLLPAFGGGLHAIRDALEHGAKVTGCTVHFVTSELDNGPIIAQRAVIIEEGDTEETLAARVLAQEHLALPQAIGLIAAGRVTIEGRCVRIVPGSVPAGR